MTTTYTAAVNEMIDIFNDAWKSNTIPIVEYVPAVQYPMIEWPTTPLSSVFWARISQQTVTDTQSTLRNGDNGQRHTARGLLFVQIFGPKKKETTVTKLRELAEMTKNTFKGHTSSDNIWFRGARVNEVAPNQSEEEKFYQINVITEYQYDEIA